jgi:hypothetical protein
MCGALFGLIGRQAGDFHHRPDFDCSFPRAWDLPGYGDGFIEVFGVDQEITSELLASFREGSVSDEPLVVAHLNAGRRRD